jgi:hypothetical protein
MITLDIPILILKLWAWMYPEIIEVYFLEARVLLDS